jgi:hypothetical protein
MASVSKLDGPGTQKLQVLEEATMRVQQLNTIVERMAMAIKGQTSSAQFVPQLKRTGLPLVGLLKGQFGPLADQVTNMMLAATRGGSEQMRLRGLREGIGLLKQSLEIAANKVKEKHTTIEETG